MARWRVSMSYEQILFERDGAVATITINREPVRNALNVATQNEIFAALREVEADPQLRVVIITGAGEKAFVAGADINELRALDTATAAREYSQNAHQLGFFISDMSKVVIAAVNGYALDPHHRRALVHPCAIPVGDPPPSGRYPPARHQLVWRPQHLPENRPCRRCWWRQRNLARWWQQPIRPALQLRLGSRAMARVLRWHPSGSAIGGRLALARPSIASRWLLGTKRCPWLWLRDRRKRLRAILRLSFCSKAVPNSGAAFLLLKLWPYDHKRVKIYNPAFLVETGQARHPANRHATRRWASILI